MNDYLAIIKKTFPELDIQDFFVLGKGNLAATCLVNKNIVFKITGTSEKALKDTEHEIYLLKLIKHNLSFNIPKILYDGKSTAERNRDDYRLRAISLICQSYNLFPLLTVEENVLYPMLLRKAENAKQIAEEKLRAVGLDETYFKRLPAMLSGGEQQRVAIARALASDAKIILADEPTGNLDTENSELVFDLLHRLAHEEGYCVIVVTHDLSIADKADEVLRLKDGVLMES